MNLHQIVAGAVGAINPFVSATISASIGNTIGADFKQKPGYADPVPVMVQRQALQYNDIAQLDGLNIQGVRFKLYLNGNWSGLVRADQKGGDIITMPNGDVYLVALVLENWPDWTSVAVTLQDGS